MAGHTGVLGLGGGGRRRSDVGGAAGLRWRGVQDAEQVGHRSPQGVGHRPLGKHLRIGKPPDVVWKVRFTVFAATSSLSSICNKVCVTWL